MLTEDIRAEIIDTFKSDIDFTYNDFDPDAEVYRFGERFHTNHPYVMIDFLPANIPKFRSISDTIGYCVGDWYQYGLCQVEVLTIHCYVDGHHLRNLSTSINGRLLCANMAEKAQQWGLTNLEAILAPYSASLDRKLSLGNVVNRSYFDTETQTQVYNYDIDFFIRTSLLWNKVPDDYDEDEEIVEEAWLNIEEPTTGTTKQIIIRVN